MRPQALAVLLALGWASPGPRTEPQQETPSAEQALEKELAQAGIRLDLAHAVASIPVVVDIREDLLEYLLVGPRGAAHESLFVTEVKPSLLNVALLSLGATRGRNARWNADAPEGAERVLPPDGDGFFLYVAWREGEEVFFFRVEDLLSNLASGQSMRRHRWVYLGSRLAKSAADQGEVFVADLEENLINIAFFYQGNTLLTAALPECLEQTIWVANAWLVPPRGAQATLLLSRGLLERLPEGFAESLPVVEPRSGTPPEEDQERADRGESGDGD